jgi:hypothetical protein
MADTQRTLSAILALLADNSSGAISPQDLRDAVVSIFANYGDVRTTTDVNYTSQTTGAGWLKLAFASDGLDNGCVTADAANDRVTVTVDGVYLVRFVGWVTAASTYNDFRLEVNAGGTAAGAGLGARAYAATGKSCVVLETTLSLTASDYVEVWTSANAFNTANTLHSGFLYVQKVG